MKEGILFLLILTAASAEDPATVKGTARDQAGATMAGVTITATELKTKVVSSTITNPAGAFIFGLAPGTYKITAAAARYQKAGFGDIAVGREPVLVLDFTLKPSPPAAVRLPEPLDLPRDLFRTVRTPRRGQGRN